MEYFMTVAAICMVFTMFPFGLFCMDIKLEIYSTPDSSTDVTCDSKVVFMCSLSTAPKIYVEWLLDGSPVSTCADTCTQKSGKLSHYTFTQNSDRTKYHLTIDPFTFNDSKSFVCQDEERVKSNTIKTNVVAQYSKDTSTIAIAEDNITVTVVVTTNCMTSPINVVPKLQYKKEGSSNASYVDFPYSTPIVNYLACTNDDNPYCGGNATMRGNTTLNIQKSYNGVTFTFLLRVEESGTLLVQQQIGSFGIKDQSTSTPRLSDTDNTGDDTQKKSYLLLVLLVVLLVAFLMPAVFIIARSACAELKEKCGMNIKEPPQKEECVEMPLTQPA